MEIWKEIPDYSGYYAVSNLGRLKRLARAAGIGQGNYARPERIIHPHKIVGKSYLQAGLTVGGKTRFVAMHRLVGQAFVPNPENKPYINHIDGNGANNAADNLEWVTNSENKLHACYELGVGVEPVVAYDKFTGEERLRFPSITKASEWLMSTGLSRDTTCLSGVVKCCKKKVPSYHGYIWRYAREPLETIPKGSKRRHKALYVEASGAQSNMGDDIVHLQK